MQFGVTHHLIGNYVRHDDLPAPAADVKAPWYSIEHNFVMESGDGALAAAADHRQGARRAAGNSASRTGLSLYFSPVPAIRKDIIGR